MSKKLLMYMLTGNVLFLFLPANTAMMMMLLGGLGGSPGGGTSPIAMNVQGSTTASNLLSSPAGVLAMSSMMTPTRSYRPRTVYVNRRYYARRRYR